MDIDVVDPELRAGAAHGFENWASATPPAVALKRRARAWLATTLQI
jgi:hypothetical protein